MLSSTVGKTDPKALQDYLATRFGLTRRSAKAIIDGRHVWVNRKCIWMARFELETGDTIELPAIAVKGAVRQSAGSRESASAKPAENRQGDGNRHVRVLFQNDNYLVCDKPGGMLSCDAPGSAEAVLRLQENVPTLEAVHRLDRDTTGCLLFAKNRAALVAAIEVFKTHKVSKTYHAIVAGSFKFAHMRIDTPLDGQNALSLVTRERTGDDAAFLRIKIETGRTNQIRRHLALVRSPILGDRVFGLKTARDPRLMQVPRQMLHASTLVLPDPLAKCGEIKAHSPLPADFRGVLRLFGMGKK